MSKAINLESLFKPVFFPSNNSGPYFSGQGCSSFSCPHVKSADCDVISQNTPIYTGYPGYNNTKIMVIGEAPSTSGPSVKGGYINPPFSKIPNSSQSPIHLLRDYFYLNYKTVPYFTDLIKCGFNYQNQKNFNKIQNRFQYCFGMFLQTEIKIIQPTYIYAIGANSYELIKVYANNISQVLNAPCVVKYFLHYSNNCNPNVDIIEKRDLIWKVQDGLPHEDLIFKSLTEKREPFVIYP